MTRDDMDKPEPGSDDMLAAEYVLGVLPAGERSDVAARIEQEQAFARLVESWEDRFSSLNDAYDDLVPPASVKTALDARLFAPAQTSEPGQGLLQSLAFWRGLSGAAIAGLLLMFALPFLQAPPVEPPSERLVASLAGEDSDVRYLVVYDSKFGEIALSHVSGDRETGRDFELWVIEGDNAPVSLGVVPVGANVHLPVAQERRGSIESGALFAISLEPAGGSPTGAPTGPVLAAGDLRTI